MKTNKVLQILHKHATCFNRIGMEYSWLWLLTSAALFVLVIQYSWLEFITEAMGAVLPTTTLFIGALVFLMFLSIQFSVRISRLTGQVKNMVQENALLREKIEEIKDGKGGLENG